MITRLHNVVICDLLFGKKKAHSYLLKWQVLFHNAEFITGMYNDILVIHDFMIVAMKEYEIVFQIRQRSELT